MSNTTMSSEALRHLQRIKPTDGWSIDPYLTKSGQRLVMLRRRNIPLSSDTAGFIDVVYDKSKSGCVVGLKHPPKEREEGSFWGTTTTVWESRGAVVLVEKDGTVSRDNREMDVVLTAAPTAVVGGEAKGKRNTHVSLTTSSAEETTSAPSGTRGMSGTGSVGAARLLEQQDRRGLGAPPQSVGGGGAGGGTTTTRRQTPTNTTATNTTTTPSQGLTEEQREFNQKLLQYFLYGTLGLFLFKVFVTAFLGLSILLIPLLLYASTTVPSDESFDAKQQLKRVLRGDHLPEDHSHKPKSWLEQTLARVQASVVTEASTAFGYEMTMYKVGFGTVVFVRVPAAKVDCYWLGTFGKWWYLFMREIPQDNKSD